jgi:hypothetical protein
VVALGLALPEPYSGQSLPLAYLGIRLGEVGRAVADEEKPEARITVTDTLQKSHPFVCFSAGRQVKLWGNDAPLFPATQMSLGAVRWLEASGLKREHWSSAAPICAMFRDVFRTAGLPYFNRERAVW